MAVRIERVTFPGSQGTDLAARLDLPAGPARAFALFAHCFTCSKDISAASRIANALTDVGFGVLRFDFTGLGMSGGEFENTNFTSNTDDLVAAVDWLRSEHRAPQLLVGHSLGGFLSVMAAARHPELARGVLLLDAPLLGGWRATTLGVIKTTQMVGAVSPGAVSRRRRNTWPSAAAALEHFQHKKAFAHWDPQVLQDYIEHGTHDDTQGQRVLSFDRDIETAIYNTLPDNLDRLLKRHPLKCPVAFIGGLYSREMKQVGMAMTGQLTRGRIAMVDGSHLFPMEKPQATAAAIEAALLNLQGAQL